MLTLRSSGLRMDSAETLTTMSTEHDPGGRQIRFLPTYTPDNPPPRLAPITWAQPTSEDNFHIIGRHVISPPGKPS